MGAHDFPLAYAIYGIKGDKKPRKRKSEYDDGIESFAGFEIVSLHVREVSEIETSIIGSLKNDTTQEEIRYFDGKYWIKDSYSEADRDLRSSSLRRINQLGRGGSTFRDHRGHDRKEQGFLDRAHIDESMSGFKKITQNSREDDLENLRKNVDNDLIEIDGVLYFHVKEPVFELFVYDDSEGPQAFTRLALDYSKPRYRSDRFEDVFRFPFDKRDELDQVVQHIEKHLGLKVENSSDGEFYYGGGDFQTFDDDRTNLLAAAEPLVRDTDWMKTWPTPRLTAWGELRDAFEEAKKPEAADDAIDQLVDKLDGFGKAKDISLHTQVAIYKWRSRAIDLDLNFDELAPEQPPAMGI